MMEKILVALLSVVCCCCCCCCCVSILQVVVCPLICDHAPMYVRAYWCSLSCSYVGGVVWTLCILTVHCVNWLRSWFTFNSYCLCGIIPTDMGYPIKCPFSFTPWCASQWVTRETPMSSWLHCNSRTSCPTYQHDVLLL